MTKLVDFSLPTNGEVSTPLQRAIQEIDIVMTTGSASFITNYNPNAGLDKYLFKTAINESYVARDVKQTITENLSTDLTNIDVQVQVQFLKGKVNKDILLCDIIVSNGGAREKLQYIIN